MRVTCRVVGSWAGVTDPHPATNKRSEIEMRRSPLVSFMIGNAPFYSCLGTIVQKLLDLHNVVRHSISVIWSIRLFSVTNSVTGNYCHPLVFFCFFCIFLHIEK